MSDDNGQGGHNGYNGDNGRKGPQGHGAGARPTGTAAVGARPGGGGRFAIGRRAAALAALLLSTPLLLSACGGGASGEDQEAEPGLLGGSVTGLDGSVVLQAGTQNVTLQANGDFQFPEPFKDGDSYSVTVAAQPAGQVCTVENATGRVADDGVTDVHVSCDSRSWAPAQLLQTATPSVALVEAKLDAVGNAVVVYVVSDGTQASLYARHGSPGLPGLLPTWTDAVQLDASAAPFNLPTISRTNHLDLAVSPGGNAHAVWLSSRPCTPGDFNPFSNNDCRDVYSARYLARDGRWEAPVRVAATATSVSKAANAVDQPLQAVVNDAGDVAVSFGGWVVVDSTKKESHAVAWRAASSAGFQVKTFADLPVNNSSGRVGLVLSPDGTLHTLSRRHVGATLPGDLLAFRGDVGSGFDETPQVLDTLSEDTRFLGLGHTPQGHVIAAWSQQVGNGSHLFAATTTGRPGSWSSPADLMGGFNSASNEVQVVGTDDGGAYVYVDCSRSRWTAATGRWVTTPMKSPCHWNSIHSAGFAPNGDFVDIAMGSGEWGSYRADTGLFRHAHPEVAALPSDHVLGVDGGQTELGFFSSANDLAKLRAASNGVALYVVRSEYLTPPSAALPDGFRAPDLFNLWAFYLR